MESKVSFGNSGRYTCVRYLYLWDWCLGIFLYCYVYIHIINISKENQTDRVNGSFKQYQPKQIHL